MMFSYTGKLKKNSKTTLCFAKTVNKQVSADWCAQIHRECRRQRLQDGGGGGEGGREPDAVAAACLEDPSVPLHARRGQVSTC